MSDKRGWGWCVQGLYSEVTKAGKGDYLFFDVPNYKLQITCMDIFKAII